MNEFELKFQVPADRLAAVEAAVRRGAVTSTRLRARYFDTAGEALSARKLVLRLRQEGRAWVQTAKGPGRGGFDRLEHEVPLAGRARPALDVARHAAHPVGELLQRALAAAGEPLEQVFETDVTRLARRVEASGTVVEIALDLGEVRAGGASARVQEVEIELKQGSAAAAIELAQSWCAEHGLWLDPLSKSGLGRRLAAGEQRVEPVTAVPAGDRPRNTGELLAGVLESALEQILGNARELAAGTGDDGHVHQLRVGLRRLRTALRELDTVAVVGVLQAEASPALEALFSLLGRHRDLATLVPSLQQEMAAAGGPQPTWQPELPDVGAAVRDPAFQQALLRVLALMHSLREHEDGGSLRDTRRTVRQHLRKLHREVERGGLAFEALEEAQRHQVRKRLKRLRYLSELMRPLFDGDRVDRYVRSLKGLQDALGHYQDAAAGRQLFAEHAAEDPAMWFGAGWLAAREPVIAAECAKAWRRASKKALPFWK